MKLPILFIDLEKYMIPCLNKKLFGIDCPGCGIQRALNLLLKGNFEDAFFMYPAIYSLILMAAFVIFNFTKKVKFAQQILLSFAILNTLIIIISYLYKMNSIFN